MKRIYIPSSSPLDWKPLLSQPERHWKAGFSAMTLARSWEAAGDDLPGEIATIVHATPHPVFAEARLLVAIPDYCVPLSSVTRATQTDLFALVRGRGGLGVLAVEGKVDEEPGPTVRGKRQDGAGDRVADLHDLLGLSAGDIAGLRHQLVYRAAAAVLLANEFCATAAAMIVHSFSPTSVGYSDFEVLVRAMGGQPSQQGLVNVGERSGVALHLGWVPGEQRFREPMERAALTSELTTNRL